MVKNTFHNGFGLLVSGFFNFQRLNNSTSNDSACLAAFKIHNLYGFSPHSFPLLSNITEPFGPVQW